MNSKTLFTCYRVSMKLMPYGCFFCSTTGFGIYDTFEKMVLRITFKTYYIVYNSTEVPLKGPSHQITFVLKVGANKCFWGYMTPGFKFLFINLEFLLGLQSSSTTHSKRLDSVTTCCSPVFPVRSPIYLLVLWPIVICFALSLIVFLVSYWLNVLPCPVSIDSGWSSI